LGVSLGINLLPADRKICSFDCIYCECGYNAGRQTASSLPLREEIHTALETKLKEIHENGEVLDTLTFAGNGEPTCHPHFPEIIDDTIFLRNRFFPKAKISVLSNASLISRPPVFSALSKVDNNILKLDTADETYIRTVNRPSDAYSLSQTVEFLKAFHGKCTIQTMFLKGFFAGKDVNNTTNQYVLPWLETVKIIDPGQVMIYTIDRETPAHGLYKASHEELDRILTMLTQAGIYATASY
jgi:wyosine [tRNA(Phe)-imidazoG37] synthetase (radical SAM superfamily)